MSIFIQDIDITDIFTPKTPRPPPIQPAHQHVFELDELLDAMARALAADAGFLHAADGAAVND
jgi:hypothetical protein